MKKILAIISLFMATSFVASDMQACVTASKAIKSSDRVYQRTFKNSCNYNVTFSYKFWNGEDWIPVSYTLGAGQSVTLSAGIDGRITDFVE
ncbi:MAG: hypothetical protein LBJ63_11095 [Prevotellaceae bacterium]|nr:hypothetical protein [Prevotellaceae bacterium]